MNETIIYKYIEGRASEEEKRCLLSWLHESEENQKYFSELNVLWHAKDVLRDNRYEEEVTLFKLNQRLDAEGKTIERKAVYRKIFWRVGTIAAFVALVLGISLFFNHSEEHTLISDALFNKQLIHVKLGNSEDVNVLSLDDGTKVWLNSGADFKYPEHFEGQNRTVYLSGNAFFKVSKDAKRPFFVVTDKCSIQVLGTEFSVNTTREEGFTETILLNGMVNVLNDKGKEVVQLDPGQQALYSYANKSAIVKDVDANALTAWRFGLIVLKKVRIGEILNQIECTCSIRIRMDTSTLWKHRYDFSFKKDETPDSILAHLSFVTGVRAECLTH